MIFKTFRIEWGKRIFKKYILQILPSEQIEHITITFTARRNPIKFFFRFTRSLLHRIADKGNLGTQW